MFKSIKDKIILNNGVEMPILGIGTMQVGNLEEIIPEAVSLGYRLIDTAANYDNEREVGEALKNLSISRDELFITSKLQIHRDGYNETLISVEDSLQKLKLDYLDLYLIHQPYGDVYGEWRALEKLYEEGKIRAIGVSNFEPFQILDLILHNNVKPAVNQIEIHPLFQQNEQHLFHEKYQIQTESWAPFAENKNNLFSNEILIKIAEKYNKSVQQIILRWTIQRNIVAIPRTSSITHLKSNSEIYDFFLSEEEMNMISLLDTGSTVFLNHLDPTVVELLSKVVANPREVKNKPTRNEWEEQRKSMNK